jgi:two-component system response regulator HydG
VILHKFVATILVIDDNDTNREGEVAVCERMGHRVLSAASGQEGVARLKETPVDLVITDLKMDGLDGLGVLRETKALDPNIAVMIFTGYGTIETAVESIKKGAFDFVEKPVKVDDLRIKVNRALEAQANRVKLDAQTELLSGARDKPKKELPREAGFGGMIGPSAAMQKIFTMIEKIAPSDTNVHIAGESGTGKELIATAIHERSKRASGPLIKVNCGAIPETLLESELFGHEKGAFTGAIKRKLGRFELADGGTIFLDEVAEIPPAMQVKLLRVLQEKEIDRVGAEAAVKVNVRIVSATNRDLKVEVDAGRFREDLFYRLHVVPVQIPPLRERTDDIIPLARFFVEKLAKKTNPDIASLSPEAESHLLSYRYPGNVRELENIIEQALVFASPPRIEVGDLPIQVSGSKPKMNTFQIPSLDIGLNEFLENAERQMILAAYEASGGVKTETARRLKIKTSALYYKLEKYGVGTVAGRNLEEAPPDEGSSEEETGA